jgi:amino acid permease
MGIFGYVSFPGEIKGNIMLNYSNANLLMTVSKMLISFILVAGLPLMIVPLRQVIEKNVFKSETYNFTRSFLISMSLCTLAYLTASQIPNIISVWSFVGAVCCNFTAYVLPPALFRKLSSDTTSRDYKIATILYYFGILLMLLCTAVSIWNACK